MTADDKQQLRNYKQNHQRGPRNRLSGVSLFKLVLADDQAETKYRVRYATDSVSYDEVIAITYAWYESENKSDIQLGDITIQLGDEWDVGAVLDTLVELSNDNWIWMDQFSLKQSDVATATLSYTIPMIFRNVRVVAFLPYRVCNRLFTHIKNFRGNKDSDVSTALAHVLLHDLACECTDGLYGWLSRLWTWQELMLASSLRFVWGLGESKWTRREFLNELMKQNDKKQRPGEGCSVSSAWPRAKTKGRKIKNSVKRSITDLSVFEQPIAKLLSELTERNTESVINAKEDSATLSMGYYFCMRLLCGAEVYMPSASRTSPINCLKVLQQIASSGRKGGQLYDCYYAAAAFIDDSAFLPKKKKTMNQQKEQDERANALDELKLRQAEVLDDPDRILEAYTDLYDKRIDTKGYFRSPKSISVDDAGLRKDYVELYHNVNNTTLVEYTGAPLAYMEPSTKGSLIVWITHERLAISQLGEEQPTVAPTVSVERQLVERMKVAALVQQNSRGGFLNALVLAGMNEEAFCETKAQGGGSFCGAAYNIKSFKRINVGRKRDFWANSIRKIANNLHPSQLNRVRNYKAMLTDMKMGFSPLAHAIIHATCFKADPFPAHLAKICSALLGKRDTKSYVEVMTTLLGESFAFSDEGLANQFELAKITFSDGTHCIGIISAMAKDMTKAAQKLLAESAIGQFVAGVVVAPFLDSYFQATIKVVKTHHRLLLCICFAAEWAVVGYIPGFDAEMNEVALGSISHANVSIMRFSAEES